MQAKQSMLNTGTLIQSYCEILLSAHFALCMKISSPWDVIITRCRCQGLLLINSDNWLQIFMFCFYMLEKIAITALLSTLLRLFKRTALHWRFVRLGAVVKTIIFDVRNMLALKAKENTDKAWEHKSRILINKIWCMSWNILFGINVFPHSALIVSHLPLNNLDFTRRRHCWGPNTDIKHFAFSDMQYINWNLYGSSSKCYTFGTRVLLLVDTISITEIST